MPDFENWTNKYIPLSTTLPGHLMSCASRIPTPQEVTTAREYISKSSRIFCELGSGSGGHLIERALKNPEALYIGIELRYKRAFRTAEKAVQKGASNLFVLRTDISHIKLFFDPASIDGMYINFPDPWDRKRWKKHRMISENSLKDFHQLIKPDGFLRYKTDHEGYFDDTLSIIADQNNFVLQKMTRDLHKSEYNDDNITTEFERLFISQGLPTYFMELVKAS